MIIVVPFDRLITALGTHRLPSHIGNKGPGDSNLVLAPSR